MSRQERLGQSHLHVTSIHSGELKTVLAKFSNLFQTCAGPHGKNHVVRNNCGGHMTISGCCGRLVETMMVTRPELKLLVSSVSAHLNRHGDGGLFLISFCSSLVLASSELDINPSTLASLYKAFLNTIISYLTDSSCPVSVKADFSDLTILMQYVKSVISSKTLLNLSNAECDHLVHLTMKTFLGSIPTDSINVKSQISDRVFYLTLEEAPIAQSHLEAGLLLRYPDLLTVNGARKIELIRSSLPTHCQKECMQEDQSCVRVCLFVCSLSNDVEEVADAHFEVSRDQNVFVEKEVVNNLLKVVEALERCETGLLLCQKVIHPSMKAKLRSKGILFVDRLGSQVIPYVQDLTGARPLRSVVDTSSITLSQGWVSTGHHVVLCEKGFLHLTRPKPSVYTLVLCAPWEERLQELKACVRAALQGLAELSKTKRLLLGGGCWQINASYMLQEKIALELSPLAESHRCSKTVILQTLAAFCGSLTSWAHSLVSHTQEESLMVDPVYFHLWRVPQGRAEGPLLSQIITCCCGEKQTLSETSEKFVWLSQYKDERFSETKNVEVSQSEIFDNGACGERIFDSLSMCVDALRQAVSTAGLFLSIGQFITDQN